MKNNLKLLGRNNEFIDFTSFNLQVSVLNTLIKPWNPPPGRVPRAMVYIGRNQLYVALHECTSFGNVALVNWKRDLIYLAGWWPKHALWALTKAYFSTKIRHLAMEIPTEPSGLRDPHQLDAPYLGEYCQNPWSMVGEATLLSVALRPELFKDGCNIKTVRCVRIYPPAIGSDLTQLEKDVTQLEQDEFGFVDFWDYSSTREERRLSEKDLTYLSGARTFAQEFEDDVTKSKVV